LLVARFFDVKCNRNLAYQINDTQVINGDRPHYCLPRFPIAVNNDARQSPQISAVNMRYFLTDAWTSIIGEPISCNPSSGMVYFGYSLGRVPLQVQITWTGGYWFDTSDDNSGVLPPGATALPSDLQGAWLLHCAEVWKMIDRLGVEVSRDASKWPSQLGIPPLVQMTLNQYTRIVT
jgi:hypothetical protein